MDTTTKKALVIAFVVVVLLMLIVGNGMVTGIMMDGKMMGNGSTGVIGWMLLPTLFVVVLDVVLFSVIIGEKHG